MDVTSLLKHALLNNCYHNNNSSDLSPALFQSVVSGGRHYCEQLKRGNNAFIFTDKQTDSIHVTMCLFNKRSQMTSKHGNKISGTNVLTTF